VAWFTIASILEKPITIYGDGKQIRDILWIDDLVEVYAKMFQNADKVAGQIFNIGGGPKNTLSLLELVDNLKKSGTMKKDPSMGEWRPGDQKVFVSNIEKAKNIINWEPKTSPEEGLKKLIDWTTENVELLKTVLA
jgi:CDP-paratose 2-epimerase